MRTLVDPGLPLVSSAAAIPGGTSTSGGNDISPLGRGHSTNIAPGRVARPATDGIAVLFNGASPQVPRFSTQTYSTRQGNLARDIHKDVRCWYGSPPKWHQPNEGRVNEKHNKGIGGRQRHVGETARPADFTAAIPSFEVRVLDCLGKTCHK